MSKGPWRKPDDIGLRAAQYRLVDAGEWLTAAGSLDVTGLLKDCPSTEVNRQFFHPNTASHIAGIHPRKLDRAMTFALTNSGYANNNLAEFALGHVVSLTNESNGTVQKLVLASSAQLSLAKPIYEAEVKARQRERGRQRGLATQAGRRNKA